MGKTTACKNQKGNPRIPYEMCQSRIKKGHPACKKTDSFGKLCVVAQEILEKKVEVE